MEEITNIKKAIVAQVIIFLQNGTEVIYRSDGIEFFIIKDLKEKIFFIAKSERSNKRKEFTKDPFSAENLMDSFAEFVLNTLSEIHKDIPPANSKSDF